jgi:hypothetical protein
MDAYCAVVIHRQKTEIIFKVRRVDGVIAKHRHMIVNDACMLLKDKVRVAAAKRPCFMYELA